MVFLRSWFEWVNEFPSSVALRESLYGYPALLTAHVVTMCLFAGLIVMMDLRLVGIAYTDTPVSQVQKRLFPWQMLGMALSSITGLLLFYGQPMRFYFKIFFWVKMVLMGLAGVNALAFHYSTYRSVARGIPTPRGRSEPGWPVPCRSCSGRASSCSGDWSPTTT